MLVRNLYRPCLPSLLFLLILPPFAHAGIVGRAFTKIRDCAVALNSMGKGLGEEEVVPPQQNAIYRKFLRQRAANSAALPKTARFSPSVSAEELEFSFYYWWYPDNQFNALMVRKFPELATQLIEGEDAMLPEPTAADSAADRAARYRRVFPKREPRTVLLEEPLSDEAGLTPASLPGLNSVTASGEPPEEASEMSGPGNGTPTPTYNPGSSAGQTTTDAGLGLGDAGPMSGQPGAADSVDSSFDKP